MKKINLLLVAVTGAAMLTFSSCDDCKDVTCENGGECVDGTCECAENYYGDACETYCVNGTFESGACTCDAGYEGDGCTVMSRDKFLGSYSVSDACSASGSSSFTITLATSSADHQTVLISNFWGSFVNNVVATVDGDDITIANQEPDSDGYTVSGTGTYNDGVINVTYSVSDGTNVDNCTSTWTKQ